MNTQSYNAITYLAPEEDADQRLHDVETYCGQKAFLIERRTPKKEFSKIAYPRFIIAPIRQGGNEGIYQIYAALEKLTNAHAADTWLPNSSPISDVTSSLPPASSDEFCVCNNGNKAWRVKLWHDLYMPLSEIQNGCKPDVKFVNKVKNQGLGSHVLSTEISSSPLAILEHLRSKPNSIVAIKRLNDGKTILLYRQDHARLFDEIKSGVSSNIRKIEPEDAKYEVIYLAEGKDRLISKPLLSSPSINVRLDACLRSLNKAETATLAQEMFRG